MSFFQNTKLFLVEATDLSKDALHVYVGLTVMLLAVIMLRKSLAHWLPLGAVVLAALAGELWDLADTFVDGRSPRFALNGKDVWNTLFWPTVLFALARFTRVLKR